MLDDAIKTTVCCVKRITERHDPLIESEACEKTPWRRAAQKFGMTQSGLARALGCHRSKISIALADEKGLINGRDQERLIELAARTGVELKPEDLVPGAK